MAPVAAAVETFEGEAKRILWLPSLTLGYIFTLSGEMLHFAGAIVAIGGARLFIDILDSDLVVESENGQRLRENAVSWLGVTFSRRRLLLLAVFAVLYVLSTVYGIYKLSLYFTHNDPVLVGIAGIYWGILVVVVLNL